MPSTCWCGNDKLRKYSDDYNCCDHCHTLVSNHVFDASTYEVEDEQNALYGENYWGKYILSMTGLSNLDEVIDLYLRERAVYWLKTLLKYQLPPASCIEVGCGLGQFSYLLNRAGFIETAMELSPQICNYIQSKLHINVVRGELCNFDHQADSIIANDVIEHIFDVNGFMRDIQQRLNPQGILIIQTPCYNDALSYEELVETNSNFLKQLKATQHIYIFSKKSISQLLANHGFCQTVFEPAFFGDDYDMYVVASNATVKQNTQEEIDEYLYAHENGRLIKALLNLFDEIGSIHAQLDIFRIASEDRLRDILKLTAMGHQIQATAEDRLKEIIKLSELLNETKETAEARLRDVHTLTELVNEKQEEIRKFLDIQQFQEQNIQDLQAMILRKEKIIEGYEHYLRQINDKALFKLLKKLKLLF